MAQQDSGQCRYIAAFLLDLYNGQRFPCDLTDLRAIDDGLYTDCMAVLAMDVRVTGQEIHTYFVDGSDRFEQLAKDWGLLDHYALCHAAQELAERASTSESLYGHAKAVLDAAKN